MNMAAARSTSPAQGRSTCVVGRCSIPVRPVRDLPDGGVCLVCGSVREQGGGPSGCKVYQLDDYRAAVRPPPPDRRRRRSFFLARLFRP